LEHPHRSALENHVHRTPRLGNHGLLNVRIGIIQPSQRRNSEAEYEHTGSDADLKALDTVRDRYVAALNAGHAQEWAAQFTEDAVQMPPNAPGNVGKQNIALWSKGFFDQFHVRLRSLYTRFGSLGNGHSSGEPTPSI
jgi:hypothetical protein